MTHDALPVFTRPATLVGHRGLGKGVVQGQVENTLGSFLGAAEAGIDWVEVDVRRTVDDRLFVAHDAVSGAGNLAQTSAGEASRGGALRLEELMEALPPTVGVVFDVKSSIEDAGRDRTATTATLLARAGRVGAWQRPVAALSFDPGSLRHLREELPSLSLGLLTWIGFPVGLAVAAAAHLDVQLLALHAASLWPRTPSATPDVPELDEVVERVHLAERQLLVWCPSAPQTRKLVDAGTDALIVDDVPRQVRVRDKAVRERPAGTGARKR